MPSPAILIWTATYNAMPAAQTIATGSARFDDLQAAEVAARKLEKKSAQWVTYNAVAFPAATPITTATSATSAAST